MRNVKVKQLLDFTFDGGALMSVRDTTCRFIKITIVAGGDFVKHNFNGFNAKSNSAKTSIVVRLVSGLDLKG